MNKRNLIISITIIILVLAVGGFYLWSQKKADLTQDKVESQKSKVESQKLGMDTNAEKQKQVVGQGEDQEQEDDKGKRGQTQNQEQNQKQLDTNSDIKYNPDGTIDTSDWKTYRNEEFGFELKYPKEWKVNQLHIIQDNNLVLNLTFSNKKHDFINSCEYILFDVNKIINDDSITFEDLFLQSDDLFKYKFSNKKYKNNNRIVIGDLMPDFLNAVVIGTNYWYRIEMGSDMGGASITNTCKDIYYEILSAFKLLK